MTTMTSKTTLELALEILNRIPDSRPPQKRPEPKIALFTDYQVSINKRIQDGDTLFFEDELEAYKVARQMRSYHYQVFNHKRQHAGYAVPK